MTALRSYRPTDRDSIASLLREHGWARHFVEGQLEAVAALSASENGATVVADDDGSVAGFVSVEIHRWNNLAQLQGLAVRAARLREGLGALLVEEVERVARERGCRGIYADTPVDNERGRAFYVARGYREDYRMSRYYSDDVDGATYVKFFD